MTPAEDGPFIRFADYDTLRAQLEAAERFTANEGALRMAAEARAEAAEADAQRWRHARKLLAVEDVENAQAAYESFGRLVNEEECARADAAIDAARTKEQQA